jgi:preprotein translocase subunit SecE
MVDEPLSTESDAKDPRHESREGRGFFGRIGLFVRQVVSELKRVVTPSREDWKSYTWVVTVFILVIVALVTVLDFAFGQLVEKVLGA